MRAFKVYVRPLLEHASCVVSCHVSKIAQIERVQRKFTKRLPRLAVLMFKDRLSKLNLASPHAVAAASQ